MENFLFFSFGFKNSGEKFKNERTQYKFVAGNKLMIFLIKKQLVQFQLLTFACKQNTLKMYDAHKFRNLQTKFTVENCKLEISRDNKKIKKITLICHNQQLFFSKISAWKCSFLEIFLALHRSNFSQTLLRKILELQKICLI